MANLARTYQRFGKNFEQDDKRRMSLIVGFYENAVFCEINEFLEKPIKGLAKFKWDGKNGHLVQKALLIRKWQTSEKNVEYAKNSSRVWPDIQIRWQNVACWQLAIFRKMTNMARSYQRFDKRDNKKGQSKTANLASRHIRFAKN